MAACFCFLAGRFRDGAGMTRAEQFQELRPLLFAIAYRILGSVSEAEDAVQETWLRFQQTPTTPVSPKAFLSAVVTRVSIDVLRSARVRREQYVGSWLPEPLTSDPYDDPERAAELADSVSIAALVLLERLTPLERAVFVLREVFAFDFPAIAAAVDRSEAACRQIAVRARRHMDEERPRFDTDRRTRERLASRFFDALRDGDVESLQRVLTADIQLSWDAGGKAPQWPQPVAGVENAARVLASLFPRFLRIGGRVEPRPINGQPGAIMHDERDRIVGTIALDILDGQVQAVRMVVNPDKLTHLGPVADAWEVVRAVYEARRDPDA